MEWEREKQKSPGINKKSRAGAKAVSADTKEKHHFPHTDSGYHGGGSFIPAGNEQGDCLQALGDCREDQISRPLGHFYFDAPLLAAGALAVRNIEGENAESRQGRSSVIQRQIHSSFLPESYNCAKKIYELPDELQRDILDHKYGYRLSDSEILRIALVEYAEVPDSDDPDSDPDIGYAIPNQAHHIVEIHDANAAPARDILVYAGIHLNAAANGVLLPMAEGDHTGNATLHWGGHSGEYANCVNNALAAAVQGAMPGTDQYRNNVLKRLAQIRNVLLRCNVPINRNVDANMRLLEDGIVREEIIDEIFRENRLYDEL